MKHVGWTTGAKLAGMLLTAAPAFAQPTAGFPPVDERAPAEPPAREAPPAPTEGEPPAPGPVAPPAAPATPQGVARPAPVAPAYPQQQAPPPAPVAPGGSAAPPHVSPYGAPPPPPPAPVYRQTLGPYYRPPNATMPGYGEPDAQPEYFRVRDASRFRHDGFYLRLAGGLGTARDSAESGGVLPTNRQLSFTPDPFVGSASGFATTTEIALGWTIFEGFVLGVGVYTATVPSASASVEDPETGDYRYRVSQQALVSPIVDYYFDEESGFHAQGGVGLASYIAGVAEPEIDGPLAQAHTSVGFGLMLGVGYEWWVASTWSMGLLARLVYGSTDGRDSRGVEWSHSTFVPSALITATYH